MGIVNIERLSKSFGQLTALDNITLNIEGGELFGLIGPDGAGKTTLFRILTTLLFPTAGMATVCGFDTIKDYKSIRRVVGYMPGRFSLYQDLSVEENINFFATLFGVTVKGNYDLVEPIYKQIEPFKNRRAGKLSGGMKQKLALSCALIHRPEVLFLDEPTTGVDAVSRGEFWDLLAVLKDKGITIIVSTPYMDEAQRCDRVALMNEGRILRVDTPEGIVRGFDKPLFSIKGTNMFRLLGEARMIDGVEYCYPFGEVHHVVAAKMMNALFLKERLASKGIENLSVETVQPTIEDVFIELMNR